MSDNNIYNEKEVLLRVAKGDEKAFTHLFNNYSGNVKHVARLFTQSDTTAEDIVQDVFMKVWLKREELITINDFRNWLFIIARNFSINALNKMARTENLESFDDYLPFPGNPASDVLDGKYLEKGIREAMQQLTEQQRTVFELAKLKGMSREEVSATLNLSPNTVKMHLVRSTRFIRAFLSARSCRLISIIAYLLN